MTNIEDEIASREYWYQTPYSELNHEHLREYEIITVPTLSAFNGVEEAICANLRPSSHHRELSRAELASYEEAIARKSIETKLRPKHFNGGQLLNGQAIIMPFSRQVAMSHSGHLQNSSFDNTEGYTVVYTGELKAAKVGYLGALVVEATYRTRKRQEPKVHQLTSNLVKRTVSKPSLREIEALLEDRDQESSDRALQLRKHALKHLYSGGLPS